MLLALALACPLQDAVDAPDDEPPPAVWRWDDELVLSSADGRNELVFEGLLQVVGGAFGSDRDPDVDTRLKRFRPELAGRLDERLRFRFEPKFTEDDVELEEAWVGTDLAGGDARLMLGRMKAPFGLEEVRSRRHIDFPEFSILNQFSPAEDHGAFLNARAGAWEWGLAAYNGTGASDTNSSKDVAGRLMWHPFHADAGGTLEHLQVGVAATVGSQDEGVDGDGIENAVGLDTVLFASGARLDGDRTRLGLEAAWFRGPWFVQAEAVVVDQEMSTGGAATDVAFRGAYLDVSHVLTGEDKMFAGVRPASPVSEGGRGAWIAALRLSTLSLDDDLAAAGLVLPGTFTDSIRSVELGLNWVPSTNAIVRTSLVRSEYDDEIALGSGTSDGETALVVELQLHW